MLNLLELLTRFFRHLCASFRGINFSLDILSPEGVLFCGQCKEFSPGLLLQYHRVYILTQALVSTTTRGTEWGCTKETGMATWKAVGRSIVEHGAPVFTPSASETSIARLHTVQNGNWLPQDGLLIPSAPGMQHSSYTPPHASTLSCPGSSQPRLRQPRVQADSQDQSTSTQKEEGNTDTAAT